MVMIDHIDHIKGSLTKRTNMGKMLNERSLQKMGAWNPGSGIILTARLSSCLVALPILTIIVIITRLSGCLVALLFKSVVGLERS